MEIYENNDEGINKIERTIKRRYSPGFKIEEDKTIEDRLLLKLSMTYDNIIKEDDTVSLKYITLKDVFNFEGSIIEDGEKLKVEYPDHSKVINSFLNKRKSYIRSMEKILAKEGSDKFIKIPRVQYHLHPYLEIFYNLKMEDELPLADWKNWDRNKKKANEYLNMLEDHKYIRIKDEIIYKGERLKIIEDETFENNKIPKAEYMLEDFFKRAYSNLRAPKSGLGDIAPYFEIANATYFTSVLNSKITKQTSEEIINIYNDLIGKQKYTSQVRGYLMELKDHDIINKDGKYFYPNEELLETFNKERNQRRIDQYIR